LRALRRHADDAFARATIEGAAHALADPANPLRLNFFATAIRILFEHTMDRYGPESEVMNASWYVCERDNKKPTRWQRVRFAIQGGLSDSFVTGQLGVDIDPLRNRLLTVVNELSKHVHGRAETIIADLAEQDVVVTRMAAAMIDFLDAIYDCRKAILEPLVDKLDEASVDALLSETIQSVDELATHHSLEEVEVNEIRVAKISADTITYEVQGSVGVVLQWGSNSDVRRGDGAEIPQSFPFECVFELPIDDPWNLRRAEPRFGVDTSSWGRPNSRVTSRQIGQSIGRRASSGHNKSCT